MDIEEEELLEAGVSPENASKILDAMAEEPETTTIRPDKVECQEDSYRWLKTLAAAEDIPRYQMYGKCIDFACENAEAFRESIQKD